MLSMGAGNPPCGGLVIVQVKRLARRGTIPGRPSRSPHARDAVVVAADQTQTYQTDYDPSFAGELRIPFESFSYTAAR